MRSWKIAKRVQYWGRLGKTSVTDRGEWKAKSEGKGQKKENTVKCGKKGRNDESGTRQDRLVRPCTKVLPTKIEQRGTVKEPKGSTDWWGRKKRQEKRKMGPGVRDLGIQRLL